MIFEYLGSRTQFITWDKNQKQKTSHPIKDGGFSRNNATRVFVNIRFPNISRRSFYSNIFWSEGPSGSNLRFAGIFRIQQWSECWIQPPNSALGPLLNSIFLKSLREQSDLEPDLDPNLGPREANEKSPIKIDQWGSRIRVLGRGWF